MFRTFAAALVLVLGVSVVPAIAAEEPASLVASAAAAAASNDMATDTDWSMPAVHVSSLPTTKRGGILPMLYVSLAGLNVYDGYTTKAGLSRGAVEANPAMRAVAGNSAALWAVKGATTASSILLAEHLWKTHRRGQAIAVMVISNGMMAAVAAHNSSIVGATR